MKIIVHVKITNDYDISVETNISWVDVIIENDENIKDILLI